MIKYLLFLALLIPTIAHADTEISTAATNLGIGTTSVKNALSVANTLAVGGVTYTSTTAPANGMIVQGNVGIGSNHPTSALDIGTGILTAQNIIYPPSNDLQNIQLALHSTTINGGTTASGSSSTLLLNDGNAGNGFSSLAWDDSTGVIAGGDVLSAGGSTYLDAIRIYQAVPGIGVIFSQSDATNSTLNLGINGDLNPVNISAPNKYGHNLSIFAEDYNATTNGNGGNLLLNAGAKNGTGKNGNVLIASIGSSNVGIGSLVPGQALDVVGTVRLSKELDFNTTSGIIRGLDASSGSIQIISGTSSSTSGDINIDTPQGSASKSGDVNIQPGNGGGAPGGNVLIQAGNAGSSGHAAPGGITINAGNDLGSGFLPDGNIIMQTTVGGNIGVGSINPTQKLDVIGTVKATKFIGDGSGLSGISGSGTVANPTATIGLTAVNGSASSAIRSDGAPALSQAISPTWTGNHLFSPSSGNTLFSTGNVGIGSVNPQTILDIGTGTLTANQVNTGSSAAGTITAGSGQGLNFLTNLTTTAVTITSAGNVGIATTLPSNKLSVKITTNGDGFGVNGSVSGPLSPQFSLNADGTQYGAFGLAQANGNYSNIALINDTIVRALNGGTSNSLILTNQSGGPVTLATGVSPTDLARMTVTGTGNVGIGTTVPIQKLEVIGTVKAIAFIGDGSGLTNVSGTGGSSGWTLGASNVGISTTNNVGIGTNLTTTAALSVMSGNVGIGTWIPSAKFQVIGTGNMGIGTLNPGQLLDVFGTVRAQGFVGNGTTGIGWSVKTGANTACNTTCGTSPCAFGLDTALAGSDIVNCTNTTSDTCVCAGP